MSTMSNSYRGFRFPAEIINQAVWLYHCFSLSLREVELILAARGIVVGNETIRAWSLRFGWTYVNSLKRRRTQSGDKWFLDEVFVRIQGELYYLWRAIDQHGNVLDALVQSRRNTKAAKRFFRKLLKGRSYVPRVIVTDKLGSYGAPPSVRSCRALNIGRAGISPTAVKSRTNPSEGGNVTCGGSSQPGMPSSFSPFTLRSTTTSNSAVTVFPPVSIGLPAIAPSLPGAIRPGLPS